MTAEEDQRARFGKILKEVADYLELTPYKIEHKYAPERAPIPPTSLYRIYKGEDANLKPAKFRKIDNMLGLGRGAAAAIYRGDQAAIETHVFECEDPEEVRAIILDRMVTPSAKKIRRAR